MSEKAVISSLDNLLRPLGFRRQKAEWNRRFADGIEAIGLQTSKAGDTVTINAGVLDRDAHILLWGHEPPLSVEAAACTVGARVGQLIDGRDHWWRYDDDRITQKAASAVTEYVLPFVERLRSRQHMMQWLVDSNVLAKKYPPPIINLAILRVLLGDSSAGCALLADVQETALGAWRARAAEVAARLDC